MATSIHSSFTPKLTNFHHHFLPTHNLLTLSPIKQRNFRVISCLVTGKTTGPINAASKDEFHGDLRIMFAAGDTGCHIYSAVAIADELKIKNCDTQIHFIGTPTGLESTAVPSAGYDFAAITAAPPLLSPLYLVLLPYRIIQTLIECWCKLGEFNPQVVVSTGGYTSFPICLTAALRGIKFVIQEQNSVPGTVNRVLSFFADKVFLAFDSTVEFFPKNKCLVCGNPVRSSLKQYKSKAVARMHFFPSSAKLGEEANVVLVLGGSLAANSINIALSNLCHHMLMEYSNLFVIWQTGLQAFNEMESLVKNHPRLILTPFLHSLDLAYAAADLVVSRAGAMTCFEILATGKPSILIPSPDDAEGHQLKNASLMADLAGAWVITEDELDSTTLENAIEGILENENLMAKMSEKALEAAKPNASAEIADHILSLVMLSSTEKK